MFTSLHQFYNSTEWRALRLQIINERRNKQDGILYDEFNGKPLLHSYDIVLHHKQQLNMSNVNNYEISLNPENIMIVSQRSHNEIHGRFGYMSLKKVYYVYGSPCSGKTTFVSNIKGNSDLVVDMDNIWQCLTGKRYEKPEALKSLAFMVRDCLYQAIKTRTGKWERAYIITGGAVKGIRERELDTFGAEPIFIDTDKETCLKRLINDNERTEENKKEWTKYINKWFEDYKE